MAKSKRSTKQEVITDFTEEVVPVDQIKKEESGDKFLDSFQLRMITEATSDVTTARLEMSVNEQYLKNLDLQIQVLQLQVEKQKLVLDMKASQYEAAKVRYNEISTQIFSAHGIESGNIGYDPISGKITA